MQSAPARTFFFIPPVSKPTGGVAVILDMAACLAEAGREVVLAMRGKPSWRPDGSGRGPGSGRSGAALPEVDMADAKPGPGDLWVVPDGWPNALSPGLTGGARCLVYVQNWAYLFNGLPTGVSWKQLPVSFAAVSRPVAWFIGQALGVDAPLLRPGIDLSVFTKPAAKPASLTVAFMPRQNKALADQIRQVVEARGRFSVTWREISGLSRAGVAEVLGSSHCFLATGFPEGCPLPPLEAMACGTVPAGFAGFGGWDYMRQAGEGGYVPPCPLDPVPWGGNGFFVPDNDVLGAALALEQALSLWRQGGPALAAVLDGCARTAGAYGLDSQGRAVLDFWDRLG